MQIFRQSSQDIENPSAKANMLMGEVASTTGCLMVPLFQLHLYCEEHLNQNRLSSQALCFAIVFPNVSEPKASARIRKNLYPRKRCLREMCG